MGTGTTGVYKDDRGLRSNIQTKLIGNMGRQCSPNFSGGDTLHNGDNKLNSLNRTGQNAQCTNASPVDAGQDEKCQFYCKDGWHKQVKGGVMRCVENSCGAQQQTKTENWQDSTKEITYNVVCMDHGTGKNILTKADIANGGEVTYTKFYSCTTGNLLSGATQLKVDYCDVGYHPVPGKNSTYSTYTGSYKCQENQYIVRYYKDLYSGNNPSEDQKGTVASSSVPTVISGNHTPAYNKSFTLKSAFSSARAGYTLLGWSTTQQKLRDVDRQSTSNYSPIPSRSAKEGSRQLNLGATATWNFTGGNYFPNYHVTNLAVFNLYAVWKRNTYTVMFDVNGGTLAGSAGVCSGNNSKYQRVADKTAWENGIKSKVSSEMAIPFPDENEPTPAPTSATQTKSQTNVCVDAF